ncbi:unnamed protein product [Peronospora effusa]|nr:unnamed protein product [Peronospora effusa]
MNIYQQNILEGFNPSTPDEVPNSSEILALLHLVIPSDDALNDMTLINSYNSIEDPCMPQVLDVSLPMTPIHDAALPADPTELIISHNVQILTEPLSCPVQSWIETPSFVGPAFSIEMPQSDHIDAQKLIELFEDTDSLQDKSKQKNRQQLSIAKESASDMAAVGAAWLKAVLVERRQCIGANVTVVAHAARSKAAGQVAKVEACAEHTVVASCAPPLAARRVLNVKENVPRIHHRSAGSMLVRVLPGVEVCAAGIKDRSCTCELKPANRTKH